MDLIRGGALLLIGIATGSSATYIFLKKRMEKKMDETVAEIKASYGLEINNPADSVINDIEEAKSVVEMNRDKPDITDYTNLYKGSGDDVVDFGSYATKTENIKEVTKDMIFDVPEEIKADRHLFNDEEPKETPYIIEDEKLAEGEMLGYEREFLIFYKDAILAYKNGETVKDVDSKISKPLLAMFLGDPIRNSINIRNEMLETDYVITKSNRKYESIIDEPSDEEDSD